MGKWFGKIGYDVTVEVERGLYETRVVEREYFGDTSNLSWTRQAQEGSANEGISMNMMISIVADPFAYQNYGNILYAEYMGSLWKVKTIDPEYPRIKLTLGGVYNGITTELAVSP